MDEFMPLAEVPAVNVPASTIDDGKVSPFPRFRILALQNDCIGLVVQLHLDTPEGWFPRGRDPFKQEFQVVITMNLDDLQTEAGGSMLKKLGQVPWAALRHQRGDGVCGVAEQRALDVAVTWQAEALRRGSQFTLICFTLFRRHRFSSRKGLTAS
jgi:hypothetical protein